MHDRELLLSSLADLYLILLFWYVSGQKYGKVEMKKYGFIDPMYKVASNDFQGRRCINWLISCFVDQKWVNKMRLIIENHWKLQSSSRVYEPEYFRFHLHEISGQDELYTYIYIYTYICISRPNKQIWKVVLRHVK